MFPTVKIFHSVVRMRCSGQLIFKIVVVLFVIFYSFDACCQPTSSFNSTFHQLHQLVKMNCLNTKNETSSSQQHFFWGIVCWKYGWRQKKLEKPWQRRVTVFTCLQQNVVSEKARILLVEASFLKLQYTPVKNLDFFTKYDWEKLTDC